VVNHAHLCVSNHESIYPSFADESYDPAVNTVATYARSVPLLWFAMFRTKNMVTRAFDTDDGPYVVAAPVTTKAKALAQLDAAIPRLNELFGTASAFDKPAAMLAEAVLRASGRCVTVEWDEVAVISEGDFLAIATNAMAVLEPGAAGDPGEDRAALLRASGTERLFTAGRMVPAEEFLPLGRLIGVGPGQ
jgi:hypothetical protein